MERDTPFLHLFESLRRRRSGPVHTEDLDPMARTGDMKSEVLIGLS